MELTEQKQIVLNRVNGLISKRHNELLERLPSVHEIDDGIVISFFTDWDNCADDNEIKFKKVDTPDNPDESMVFFFIPKGAFFELKQRFYIGCMTCLSGAIDITANNKTKLLEATTKICINTDDVIGKAYENTYLIVCSDRSEWGNATKDHVKELGY